MGHNKHRVTSRTAEVKWLISASFNEGTYHDLVHLVPTAHETSNDFNSVEADMITNTLPEASFLLR